MVVLDTCAIIEACQTTPSFSAKVAKQLENGFYLLSLSFAEIACKVKLGKLELGITPRNLYKEYLQIKGVEIIDINVDLWLDSIELAWSENKDPMDRAITAFAMKNHLTIISSDKKIKKFYKKVMW